MKADAPLLRLQGVTRGFGGLMAVDGVSFDVPRGAIVGVIGPNGAGKTTLFNLITGFTSLSSGSITYEGREIAGLSADRIARLGVGRTFQNLRTMADTTVFDCVSIGAIGKAYGSPFGFVRDAACAARITQATLDALTTVGLEAESQILAMKLPYGRRKHLEIARALAGAPSLLILDEPAAGLNETETGQLGQLIDTLSARGITILLVEHHMEMVMTHCHRVVVLSHGRKLAEGAPDTVRTDPAVIEAYLGTAVEEHEPLEAAA